MSAALYSASGDSAVLQGTSVGGSKPLHRFIKAQPKAVGVVMLVLGLSFIIITIVSQNKDINEMTMIPPTILLGIMLVACGTMYILTEHKPSKRTVTISLALTIVAILGSCWAVFMVLPSTIHGHHYQYYRYYDYEDNSTETEDAEWFHHYENMSVAVESVFMFHTLAGVIVLIVMSSMAGAALRSMRNQILVRTTPASTETPPDEQ